MKTTVVLGALLFVSLTAAAQPSVPAFEVASIKPSAPITGGRFNINMGGDAGRINYSGVPLRMLMTRAYAVKDYQINGPEWLASERFDVVAKIADGAKKEDVPAMLRALLIERFKITTHSETKEMPVYALVPAKGGIKAKEVDASVPRQMKMMYGKIEMQIPMSALAEFLARIVDRPVLDLTETTSAYDINLEYTPEPGQGAMKGMPVQIHGGGDPPSMPEPGPSIFTALQEQLGLKLESRKAPVEILVVDHAEKIPAEN